MRAVDSSVVIAGFASWHQAHQRTVEVLASRPVLPVGCALEAYAVMTRMPPPHRADGSLVRDVLRRMFDGPGIGLSDIDGPGLVGHLVDRGVTGGASYDATIALACLQAGLTLVTLDRRARGTYERSGASVEFLGDGASD